MVFQQIVLCLVLNALTVTSFVLPKITTTTTTTTSHNYNINNNQQQLQPTSLFCELWGMNCAIPTEFAMDWQGFSQRGGGTDIHKDGWGIAFYEHEQPSPSPSPTSPLRHRLRQFRDVEAAATSRLAKQLFTRAPNKQRQSLVSLNSTASAMMEEVDYNDVHPNKALNLMGHIRYATVGEVNKENVHPFVREMGGRTWCFCHNGQVPLFHEHPSWKLTSLQKHAKASKNTPAQYTPVGTTDSEATFCAILNALVEAFPQLQNNNYNDVQVDDEFFYEPLQTLLEEITDYDPKCTILNCLFTTGPHTQYVYSWPGSRPGSKVWNGLHYTLRNNHDTTTTTTPATTAAVIATKPLNSHEAWVEMKRNELILFHQGQPRRLL